MTEKNKGASERSTDRGTVQKDLSREEADKENQQRSGAEEEHERESSGGETGEVERRQQRKDEKSPEITTSESLRAKADEEMDVKTEMERRVRDGRREPAEKQHAEKCD